MASSSARMMLVLLVGIPMMLTTMMGRCDALPAPDSAGIVEMVNGLAYGGIPYGSVSGALANYEQPQRLTYPLYNSIQATGSVLVPDTRTYGY